MKDSLTKSQVKAIEMLGRQSPAGLPIFFTGTTILTNGYTVIKINKPLPDIEHDDLDAGKVKDIIDKIENTADAKSDSLFPIETMTHPNGRIMIERYGKNWYDPEIVKRSKRVLGGKEFSYREFEMTEKVTGIRIDGKDGWAAILPIEIKDY